jgi:uncharacterized membrane-anchored protein
MVSLTVTQGGQVAVYDNESWISRSYNLNSMKKWWWVFAILTILVVWLLLLPLSN